MSSSRFYVIDVEVPADTELDVDQVMRQIVLLGQAAYLETLELSSPDVQAFQALVIHDPEPQ